MTTFSFRPLASGTLAILLFAGTAAAQAIPPVLSTLGVRNRVASGERADSARLSAHFAALATRYADEAKRHEWMARSFAGNPNRNTGSGMSLHCRQLAALNNDSAATLRELARHHERLAAGMPSTPPREGARFEAGAGASEPGREELRALAGRARTPLDHHALAEYFQTAARRYRADANAHAAIAASYRGTRIAQAAAHWDRMVSVSRQAAKEATAAAEMHAQLANIAW